MTRFFPIALILALVAQNLFAQQPAPSPSSLVERIDSLGFVQLQADSFKTLDPKQKVLAYWLSQAAIAIDPIIYDQNSRFGLRQKRLLEEIVAHPAGINPAVLQKITAFAKLFWGNRGNHNDTTSQKFLPEFTFVELQAAARIAQQHGAFKTNYATLPPLPTVLILRKEIELLKPSLFDASFEPLVTAKHPQDGKDLIQSSSNTFYGRGVTAPDLKNFTEHYPLNSRVMKSRDGKLHEEIYRAGNPDGTIKPGLYAIYLNKAIACLEKARAFADPQQAQVIADLERYYQTGDFQDWLKFDADWVQNNEAVDFVNGFIEVYHDVRGAKGSSQSFVSVTDQHETEAMRKLADNAAYFEQKAPWDEKYKKHDFKPPVVKAVETVVETGDFGASTIGDNLPNENAIHEKYGTKNFLLMSSSRALQNAQGYAALEEFASSPEEIERGKKYGDEASGLLTAMHEVIGHGSGKLSDRLQSGAEPYLKEYFSTLEEARADLMALWNVWDPKLKELGLISDQENVAKTMYDHQAQAVLLQLRSIPHGDTIEEDHQRDRALIANYIMDKTGAIELFQHEGKQYIRVTDYQEMHTGVGMLLGELMRIKAEGDYDAIKALVEKYGVHFNPALRDEVIARYKKLALPTYWAGVNSELTPHFDKDGSVTDVDITYPRDAVRQYLRYGAMYDPGLSQK